MKTETFNHIATTKILKHTCHPEAVLEARDLYLVSESIEQANNSLKLPESLKAMASFVSTNHHVREEDGISDNLDFLEAQFTKEGEGIKFRIDGITYRILGETVTVETEL